MMFRHTRVKLFEVREEVDQTEGRGGTRVVGYALSQELADANAASKGVMGGPGHIREIEGFELSDEAGVVAGYILQPQVIKPEDILNTTPKEAEDAKRRALEKLTPYERKLLGL